MTPADDHGQTTSMQRAQWESSQHRDPMHDSPFTMGALLVILGTTIAMTIYLFLPATVHWGWR